MSSLDLETIQYSVNIQNVDIDCEARFLIPETIYRLPEDVQQTALEIIYVVAEPNVSGFTFLLNITEPTKAPFTLLNFSNMRRMSKSKKMSIIAHEIAHHVLDHESGNGGEDVEREADDLVQRWGFKRANS